ncbi:MAG TPA: NUDIX hydrolase [Gaiellaceae bacterium]|nr:NUDIX hydrolase [Gaiellaceae bacterium]
MRWTVHGERSLYESEWMSLRLVDVELPSGARFEHHVLRIPREAAAAVVHDPARGVLLLRRHRFVTDSWGWEIPGGRVDEGETPAEAAARETLEETGWRPGPLRALFAYHPAPGGVDQTFHVFLAEGAVEEGEPDVDEAERVEWVPLDDVRALVADGQVTDGYSLTALLWVLAQP